MSVNISITDPANTSPKELSLVVDMINYFIANNTYGQVGAPRQADLVAAPAIPSADNPAAGRDATTPQAAFGSQSPAAAFGGANPAAFTPVPVARTPEQMIADAAAKVAANGITPVNFGAAAAPALVAPVAPEVGVQRDSAGIPYDKRIHAKGADGPVKNADGTWRAKRGITPQQKVAVEAELMQALAAGHVAAPSGLVPAPPAAVIPVALVPNVQPAPISSAASPTASDGAAPLVTGSAAPAIPNNFITMVGKVNPMVMSGRLTQDEVAMACSAVGLPNLQGLMMRPDLVGAVNETIDAILASKG